jgi:hypothetical protein
VGGWGYHMYLLFPLHQLAQLMYQSLASATYTYFIFLYQCLT